jgi:hypothetical protein
MRPWMASSASLAAAVVLLSGCADRCGVTPAKLAALQRGMSYDEASQIMGCYGRPVSRHDLASGGVTTVEWNGPGPGVFIATQVDFLDDRLLYYTTRSTAGF